MAGQSDTGVLLSQEDMQMSDSQEALWLVYKWESLQPIAFYPGAEQPRFRAGLQFWGMDTELQAVKARCRMLRRVVCSDIWIPKTSGLHCYCHTILYAIMSCTLLFCVLRKVCFRMFPQ